MAIINDSLSTKLTTTTLLADAINKSLLQCDHKNIFSFTHNELVIHKIVISSLCIIFGICFIMAGYRFLKISTFFTGFSIGTLIIYFILNEQKVLTISENLIISLSIGILFALVSLLVQYIGIFLLGVTCSSIFVCCILVLVDLFHTNKSIWLCILLLFFGAIIIASLTLKFQKLFSILNTSCIGAALFTSGLDYFIEYDYLLNYIYDLLKVNNYESKDSSNYYRFNFNDYDQTTTTTTTTTTLFNNLINNSNSTKLTFHQSLQLIANSIINSKLCWYTWIVFTGFFLLLIIGILIQCLFTGKNYSHKDSWHHILKNRYRTKSANLEKIRRKSNFKTAINSNNTDDETRIINSNSNNNIATNFNSLNINANNQNTNSATTTSSFIFNNNEETINSNNENTKSTAKLISLNYKPSSSKTSTSSSSSSSSQPIPPSSPLLNTKSSRNSSQNKQLLLNNKDTNAKFRYLYQIRRVNGDVLSKDFLNNFNNKQNNNTTITPNNDNNNNKDNNNNNKQTNSNSGSSPQSTASSSSTKSSSSSSSSSSKKSKRNNSNNIDSSTATTLTRII